MASSTTNELTIRSSRDVAGYQFDAAFDDVFLEFVQPLLHCINPSRADSVADQRVKRAAERFTHQQDAVEREGERTSSAAVVDTRCTLTASCRINPQPM
jgi:hypothetical protein